MDEKIVVIGIPSGIERAQVALFRGRLTTAFQAMKEYAPNNDPVISIGSEKAIESLQKMRARLGKDKSDDSKDTPNYMAVAPSFSFSQLILPKEIKAEITSAIQVLAVESLVFDEWGLRQIEPNPKTALNFYGPPGTGKTLAAHAIADYLGKKILVASYAEIESKYHGDGPKNVKALFQAAEKEDAVLFIDEADSLLSKRLTNVTQGSEQAINSMRSQLLINLELFRGVVIFSTNLVQNYDKAFETRVRHIQFVMPDEAGRKEIWNTLLPSALPLAPDVSIESLAKEIDDICGRDIKNAIIHSAVQAALSDTVVSHEILVSNINKIKAARIKQENIPANAKPLDEKEKKRLEDKIKQSLHSDNTTVEIQ